MLMVFVAMLVALVWIAPVERVNQSPETLIQPIVALAGLTAIVALMMLAYRNFSLVRGTVTLRYFQAYTAEAPAERIERPSRAYMNLLELPVLFYLVCVLMLITGKFDAVQVSLAWIFVSTRFVHAFIHIGFNHVPFRFTAFLAGFITLIVIWTRFASQNL
ncbi:MAG: MAPEG family protein [Burkholderiaceae bacterium]